MIPTKLVMEAVPIFASRGWDESVARAEAELERREALLTLLASRGVHHPADLKRILLNSGR